MSNIVPLNDIQSMAKTVATSGLFGFKNENQAMTIMLLSQSENKHPMELIQKYHIINGKPALKSSEVLSRFQLAGGKIKYIVSDDNKCEVEFTHEQAGSITIKWDIEKAKKAGVYDSNPVWKKYPSNMLRSRCITDGVIALYPACLGGALTESMAQDIPTAEPTIEDAEIVVEVEHKPSTDAMKLKLSNRLKELGFSSADVKEFATRYKLNDDVELLEELANSNEVLMELVNKFEGKE